MTKKNLPFGLPGDLSSQEMIQRIIRVDHAGEYGAKRIYEGQASVFKGSPTGDLIEHMKEQEQQHLNAFENYMKDNHVRPSVLHPLWHVAGFALGAITAKMGEKAAMACTVAIEEVIAEHYQNQIDLLNNCPEADNPQIEKLKKDIIQFREEEIEHKDIGLEHDAELTPGYTLLSQAIKKGSKLAIWLAERF